MSLKSEQYMHLELVTSETQEEMLEIPETLLAICVKLLSDGHANINCALRTK